MNRRYTYWDEWDDIVSRFIQKNEPYRGYWSDSEQHALRLADASLTNKSRERLLDLGCGRGRLLPRFANAFEEVVALDSDEGRISEARKLAHATSLENIRFINRFFEDCASELGRFDMILCSHVIQHLPADSVGTMIGLMHSVLTRSGVLVLLTSHAVSKHDVYKLWRLNGSASGTIQENLDRDAFERIVANDSLNGGVPTHAFAIGNLRSMLAGYEILKVHCFHALHTRNIMDAIVFRDNWINTPGLKGLFGIDVLVIAKK